MNNDGIGIFISKERLSASTEALWRELQRERILFDSEDPATLQVLRRDAERIAASMDSSSEEPPMLWSGVPWPRGEKPLRSDYCLSISVGGSKTVALLLRIDDGDVIGLAPGGEEVRGDELESLARNSTTATPTTSDTADGFAMIEKIVRGVCDRLGDNLQELEDCANIVLSWGFAAASERTHEDLLGGLTVRTTLMTKMQGAFTADLQGRDLCALFAEAFEKVLGWSRPVTVANDGIMALHYFLAPRRRRKYSQIGLFINGTGCNFALAEPYAVRPGGIVSSEGERYEPQHLVGGLRPAPGDQLVNYFINYEIGSIKLETTKSRFDTSESYQIQTNALSGGNAFRQQFQGLGSEYLGADLFQRLLEAYRCGPGGGDCPDGPQISALAGFEVGSREALARLAFFFPEVEFAAEDAEKLLFICRAIVDRSALHAALLLAAVSFRVGFGLGSEEEGLQDLLGIEGSIWSIEGYPERVLSYWEALCGERELNVKMACEPGFNASLHGPAFFAAIHVRRDSF